MIKFILILTCCLCITTTGSAQSVIKGKVADSTERNGIANAVVLVLHAKDSMLVTFTRTQADGSFAINQLKEGRFLLLISASGYVDYSHEFRMGRDSSILLGTIPMLTIEHVLQEVIVQQTRRSIRIKGDTTEYAVDSFKVGVNATMEDLLRVLPGFVIDNQGNIIANGKPIKEVLVDGEPFFSDDPTLVTRNLRSSMVDKVKMYDKKSDLAAFSGIDMGKKNTVLDFKLKENKKRGYFGNISAAGGTGGYQNVESMFNLFNGPEKFSVYGIVSNTGNSGLSRQDINRFADNSIFSAVNEMADPLDLWAGTYDGKGYPLLQTAGLHYNNKWHGDTLSVNSNYRYFNLGVEGSSNTDLLQVLNSKTLHGRQQQNYHNQVSANRVNGYIQFIPDSTSTLKINIDGSVSRKRTGNTFQSATYENEITLLNAQQRSTSFLNNNNLLFTDIIWMKKFKKTRRTLSASIAANNKNVSSSGYINAIDQFYRTSGSLPDSVSQTDQFKENSSREYAVSGYISYSEPISRKSILNVTYGQSFYNGAARINSFNKGINLAYHDYDSLFSSDYTLYSFRQKLNLQYVLTGKKYRFAVGDEYNDARYQQEDLLKQNHVKRTFLYHNPMASFFFSPNGSRSLGISYTGTTTQPLLQQLQPIVINLNPLAVYVGNPDLNPSITHTLSFNYLQFILKNNQSISATMSFSTTQDAIGLNSFIDNVGKNTNQWVNIDGSYSGNFSANYSGNMPGSGILLRTNLNVQANRYGNIINGQLSYISNYGIAAGFALGKSKDRKYNINIGANLSYNESRSSLQQSFSNKYFSLLANYSVDIFLPARFQVHTEGNMITRQQVAGFERLPVLYFLQAWAGKKFLRDETLLLKITANNILNTNGMNTRTAGPGFVSQSSYDVIGRYLLFTAAWNFLSNASK